MVYSHDIITEAYVFVYNTYMYMYIIVEKEVFLGIFTVSHREEVAIKVQYANVFSALSSAT